MSGYTVGKDVLSYCTKCKLSLSHIIVSMKDASTIAKVKCNTCTTIHMYHDPSTKTKKVKSKSLIPGGKTKSMSVSDMWTNEIGKSIGKPKVYTIKGSFTLGDIIDHKSFGPGIVQELVDDKISVLFQHEIKLLVHNK